MVVTSNTFWRCFAMILGLLALMGVGGCATIMGGGGEQVVSGVVTPDRYWISDERVRARAAEGLRTLRDDEARRVAELVRTAERGFGAPVDVEFCWEGRELWLVQCRTITTL